ncbi:zinc-dependent peptidase [Ferruginibacter sp. HRS2-29]|uniref:M90 family metallopeptidase n=1 Tax=Ferruginibacter sp. HRS2-29 TaxID=2487334 RepID=UPI0020CEE675|nr:M90 family metallopeptidase [Ferruginibacter sp. HRS2-29]
MPADSVSINASELEKNVLFYSRLSPEEKKHFEEDVLDFLQRIKITPVNTTITDTDRLLIAAGAVIPIFYFPDWKYYNLKEVLVYNDTFNHSFESAGNNSRDIMGMVGSGYMEGKMLLSKPSLEQGFGNKTDKNNTVIHEFVHLLDKSDGDTDGIPELLLDKQFILPWVDMIHQETKKIVEGRSDIDPYAYTNQAEFFAVVSEYFFERPDLLKSKHPKLYGILHEMFRTPN